MHQYWCQQRPDHGLKEGLAELVVGSDGIEASLLGKANVIQASGLGYEDNGPEEANGTAVMGLVAIGPEEGVSILTGMQQQDTTAG